MSEIITIHFDVLCKFLFSIEGQKVLEIENGTIMQNFQKGFSLVQRMTQQYKGNQIFMFSPLPFPFKGIFSGILKKSSSFSQIVI